MTNATEYRRLELRVPQDLFDAMRAWLERDDKMDELESRLSALKDELRDQKDDFRDLKDDVRDLKDDVRKLDDRGLAAR